MEQRKSQSEILNQLVSEGHLTSDQADEIVRAPVLGITVRELVSYLAAILISIGVMFIVGGLIANVAKAGIAAMLFVVAAVLGFYSHKLSTSTSEKKRAGEVLEIAAVLATAFAFGILFDMSNMNSEWFMCILALASGTWGAIRASRSQFSGSIVLAASTPVVIVAFSSALSLNGDTYSGVVGSLLIAGGLGLILAGMRKIGLAFLPRSVGSLLIVIGSITLALIFSMGIGGIIPIGIGAAVFALGSHERAPESLITGAIGIIVGVIMTISYWVPGPIFQGLAIIACGSGLLIVLRTRLSQVASQPKPDAPTA